MGWPAAHGRLQDGGKALAIDFRREIGAEMFYTRKLLGCQECRLLEHDLECDNKVQKSKLCLLCIWAVEEWR